MERISRTRAGILMLIFALILVFYALHLFEVQVIETGGSTDNSTTYTVLTRVKAARGDILDCHGNVLVSNRATYDLVINHYVLLNAKGTNDHLYRLVQRCQEQGITFTDHFPISKERPFVYTLDQYNSSWQSYFQSYLSYKGGLDSDITAPLLMEKLREKYKIPAEWSEELARQVIGLRYELDLRSCVSSMAMYVFLSDASDQELSAIVELNVPGLKVEPSTVREYNTKYASHILGFVGPMNAEQWEYYREIPGYEMDAEVGQDGLEAAYEEYLHGVDGWREDTVTADGTLVESKYYVEPQAGNNMEVSIDINLQMAAEDQMAKVIYDLKNPADDILEFDPEPDGMDVEGGAVVAINVKTGQVLTCASYPSYDLSTFFEDYEELSKDPLKPFYNRALLATYPPGSTYKMNMVISGIMSGAINSQDTIYDEGRFILKADEEGGEDLALTCLALAYGYTHKDCNAARALQVSCNYFFYELANRVPLRVIDGTAKALGLGEETGVELPEYIGHRANEETKKELYDLSKSGWYDADQVLMAIGQSDNLFSPIQLAVYAATLANQGTRYQATFMSRVVSADYRTLLEENKPTVVNRLEISDEAYNAIKEGMHMVASTEEGTAWETFKNYPIKIAAKTGTAQHGIMDASDNGAFVCFAPLDDPQIAIAVYVEKGGHGSTLATIAKAMLDVYFEVGEVGDVPIYENKLS